MKKIMIVVGILVVFMLVAISFASAFTSGASNAEKKESPLYRLRTRRAIGEKISNILEDIKTKFLGERIFSLPFGWLVYQIKILSFRSAGEPTCLITDGDCFDTCAITCYGATSCHGITCLKDC